MPGGPSIPVPTTGRTQRSPTSTKATRARIESNETNTKRLQANRKAQPTLVHQLANAGPMSQVADGQTLVYDAATGQYVPADLPSGFTPYASLTGAGETNPFGALTQDGDFQVQGGTFVVNDTTGGGIHLNTTGSFSTDSDGVLLDSSNTMILSIPAPAPGGSAFALKGGANDIISIDPTLGSLWDIDIGGSNVNAVEIFTELSFLVLAQDPSHPGQQSILNMQAGGADMAAGGAPSPHDYAASIGVLGYDPTTQSGKIAMDATGLPGVSIPIAFLTGSTALALPAVVGFPSPTFAFTADGHIAFNLGSGWTVLV